MEDRLDQTVADISKATAVDEGGEDDGENRLRGQPRSSLPIFMSL